MFYEDFLRTLGGPKQICQGRQIFEFLIGEKWKKREEEEIKWKRNEGKIWEIEKIGRLGREYRE
jgi:hypothetical protein